MRVQGDGAAAFERMEIVLETMDKEPEDCDIRQANEVKDASLSSANYDCDRPVT